jgi:hypothetical protein
MKSLVIACQEGSGMADSLDNVLSI